MRFTGCRSLKDYLLREVYRVGEITSLAAQAARLGFDRAHLWSLARELEAEGRIVIERPSHNGPLVLRPSTGRPLSIPNTLCYQLAFWPKGV